jgi:hypothetical protein
VAATPTAPRQAAGYSFVNVPSFPAAATTSAPAAAAYATASQIVFE